MELKVTNEYVKICEMNCNGILVLCQCQEDSVFTQILLSMVDVKFLGFWKESVFDENDNVWCRTCLSSLGVEMCRLSTCDESFSFCFTIKSEFHYVGCFEGIMDGGSLPWRISIVNLKVVSHGDKNTVINPIWGSWNESIGWCLDSSLHGVLELVNLGPKMLGSWNESIGWCFG